MKFRLMILVFLFVLAGALPSTASGAPATSNDTPQVIQAMKGMVEYHVPEILLALLSVVVMTITAERIITLVLAREEIVPTDLLRLTDQVVRQRQLTPEARAEVLKSCRDRPGAFGRVVTHTINRAGLTLADVQAACQAAMEMEQRRVGALTGHLALIGRTAPFVGLFGTVVGVMVAFFEATQRAGGQESMLAEGLSTALTTTAAGIVVALMAITAAHFSRHHQYRLFDRMGTALLGLLPVVAGASHPVSGTGGPETGDRL